MHRIILISVLMVLALAFAPSAVHADPPDPDDCNDPSDSGPLVPGDCGYVDVAGPSPTGENIDQVFQIYLPAVIGGGPSYVNVWFQMYRDVDADGSFGANEYVEWDTDKSMFITGETGATLSPVIGVDGMTLRGYTYRAGEELYIQAQELDGCAGWDGVGFFTVPSYDVIILQAMHPYDNC